MTSFLSRVALCRHYGRIQIVSITLHYSIVHDYDMLEEAEDKPFYEVLLPCQQTCQQIQMVDTGQTCWIESGQGAALLSCMWLRVLHSRR